jgi:hypothetical protein
MRLYDLRSGNTIQVLLHQSSRDHGSLNSPANQAEQYDGEYVLLDRYSTGGYPRPVLPGEARVFGGNVSIPDDLPELYGFGKNSNAQPVGTGILVGKDSTVIQIVLYRISSDNQTGDGVAKDNKGRYFRVYFSTDGQ